MPWFYYVGGFLARTVLILFTRWQVNGKENIPKEGPLLVIVNHVNLADPPVIRVSLNRRTIFMAKEELFRSRLTGYFIGCFGSFPVHRSRLDMKALRQADHVLAQGVETDPVKSAHLHEERVRRPLQQRCDGVPERIGDLRPCVRHGWLSRAWWRRPRIGIRPGAARRPHAATCKSAFVPLPKQC